MGCQQHNPLPCKAGLTGCQTIQGWTPHPAGILPPSHHGTCLIKQTFGYCASTAASTRSRCGVLQWCLQPPAARQGKGRNILLLLVVAALTMMVHFLKNVFHSASTLPPADAVAGVGPKGLTAELPPPEDTGATEAKGLVALRAVPPPPLDGPEQQHAEPPCLST